jgi:enoyl-CoA hydratase/carnithine racemase
MTMPDADVLAATGLVVEQSEAVLTITLNRPDTRNAQTPSMWRMLAAVGESVPPEVHVVVIRGAGPSFSAGLDQTMLTPEGIAGERNFSALAALPDGEAQEVIAEYQRAFSIWRSPRFVSVAAVQGHAVGAGFQLALACDLRVLADDAQLCMKEPALGLVPDLGGTAPLVDAVGYSRALEMCLTSRWVPAYEAASLGLATAVVPLGELDEAVDDLAAALSVTLPGVTSAVKQLLLGAGGRTYDEQRAAERAEQVGRLRDLVSLMQHD